MAINDRCQTLTHSTNPRNRAIADRAPVDENARQRVSSGNLIGSAVHPSVATTPRNSDSQSSQSEPTYVTTSIEVEHQSQRCVEGFDEQTRKAGSRW